MILVFSGEELQKGHLSVVLGKKKKERFITRKRYVWRSHSVLHVVKLINARCTHC